MVAAVEHLTELRGDELAAAAGAAAARAARTRAVLEILGDTSPAGLRRRPGALGRGPHRRGAPRGGRAAGARVGRETHRITVELLDTDESQPGDRELVQATLDLVRGLGLANTLSDDPGVGARSSTAGRNPRPALWRRA